jgi:Bacterial phospho-glucose isomerase C-terminal SIS domain
MELDVSEYNSIISLVYILDYFSIYLAISRNVNPAPTPAIDILNIFDNNTYCNIRFILFIHTLIIMVRITAFKKMLAIEVKDNID